MSKIYFLIIFASVLVQSCFYGGYRAEEEIVNLQHRLDTIYGCQEEMYFMLSDNDTLSAEIIDSLKDYLIEIEYQCNYNDFDFTIP